MLEHRLIEYCAPTLAGLKCANLFSCYYHSRPELEQEILEMNRRLNSKGVYIEIMKWRDNAVLIYTYRPSRLKQDLCKDGVRELLTGFGYENLEPGACVEKLRQRILENDCFPHEIGIFLGYPLEDVIGFIEQGPKNCKCCGFWKVYCNEQEKIKEFEKLKKCHRVYTEVFAGGRGISQMTVCA